MEHITIVINSVKRDDPRVVKHLMDSLQPNPGYTIILVVGGCDTYETIQHPTYTEVRVTHNSIDNTGLIAYLEGQLPQVTTPWFLYLHDTCKAGPSFFTKLTQLATLLDPRKTVSFPFPSMNIGMYSVRVVEQFRSNIMALKNTFNTLESIQRCKAAGVRTEDCVFKLNRAHHAILGRNRTTTGPTDYYGNGIPRIVEYFEALDLYKIKANWYAKPVYELRA
jgi:hypothetical protein